VTGARILRRALPALAMAIGATLAAAPKAHAGLLFPESGGSPNADSIHTLYVMVFILGLVIFFIVEGTLVWSLFKFKARRGRSAAQIHGNTKLEIGWTVGAAVILVFITAFTFIKLPSIKDPKPSLVGNNGQTALVQDGELVAATDNLSVKGPALHITVNGQQYVWRYAYPGKEKLLTYTDLVVPVGETVILKVTADDVAHSFWIPKLGGKMDAIPGYVNQTWFRIPPDAIPPGKKSVIYTGQCAELCGRNHANMYARVIGMRMDDYKAWYRRKVQQVAQARKLAAAQQKALLQQQKQGQ
jgi:cytochrome c oxidase subunit 2